MVRFIFFCMAVMALSLAAIPFTNMVGGIDDQRTDIIASAEPAAGDTQNDVFASGMAEEPSADSLNAIESAAGGTVGSIEDTSTLSGGFGTAAPKALADTEAQPVDTAPAPQDN